MWRSAELTKDYKEGDKSLQLRLEDETVSAGGGRGGSAGVCSVDQMVPCGLESFPQLGASEPLASSLWLLTVMLSERATP